MNWRITDDRVMGGKSQGRFEITQQGVMKFRGNLSLENNGGFSSVRSGDLNLDLSNSAGLLLRVKGDGRTYQMRLGTDARYRSWNVSFSAKFKTKRGSWVNLRIPFDKFEAGFRGRSLEKVSFDPSKIRRFGILLGDKKPGSFELEIDSISTYSEDSPQTILGLAKADKRFGTLALAITKAGLDAALNEDGPFTVFAPTNEAFSKLPKDVLDTLLTEEGLAGLTSILKHHVVPGDIRLATALRGKFLTSLEGTKLEVDFKDGSIQVNGATLKTADISANNGVIHAIDTVLIPSKIEPKTILETALEAGNFKTLLKAVETVGLTDYLASDDSITIFAPTDEAFKKLPKGTVEQLLKPENRDQLNAILINHAVQGTIEAGDALKAGSTVTLGGKKLTFKINNGTFKVNGSTINTADLTCSNGVIHIISDVILFPADNAKAQNNQVQNESKGELPQEVIMSAIQRGVPLYNHGDAEACAEIYRDCINALTTSSALNEVMRNHLARTLEISKGKTADQTAWMYRFALDQTMFQLNSQNLKSNL